MGVNYQPQLFAISNGDLQFSYAHMLNFGFYWRFAVIRGYKVR
jgi:hypothetical protein